jgi:usherin
MHMHTLSAPDEQAPPDPIPLSATSIQLTWLEPEAPNGIILGYVIYRNGTLIANVSDLSYNDTELTPDTVYSYVIEAFNVIGSTRSQPRPGRTLEGAPTGVQSPTLTALSATSISASWVEPETTNGVISRYELVRVTIGSESVIVSEEIVFTGLAMSATVTGLRPFTDYFFVVRACTSGGCGSSEPSSVRTSEAPPTFQPAPNVTSQSSSSLLITWDIPTEPNGNLTRYDIVQRNSPFTGEGFAVGMVLSGGEMFTVNGLRPFTIYEFRVVAYTGGGGTASEWTNGITDEDSKSVCSAIQSLMSNF